MMTSPNKIIAGSDVSLRQLKMQNKLYRQILSNMTTNIYTAYEIPNAFYNILGQEKYTRTRDKLFVKQFEVKQNHQAAFPDTAKLPGLIVILFVQLSVL